uniref:CBS domain-containing protein CBSX5-like n=1 Tax=Nelumbo nucifera TaxID=4432 RepID=A0A822Z2X7_NELNU|nr:TPA_asm: hypothetical protein HUJ06_008450 [Nelumbo nucifera]
MAVGLLTREVFDLCLGKPALRSLSISATVSDVLLMLKGLGDNFLSVWSCNHSSNAKVDFEDCRCVLNLCMVDVICYLYKAKNLASPSSALKSPVSVFLTKPAGILTYWEWMTTSRRVLAIGYHDMAYFAMDLISSSLSQQTLVAVIDDDGKLIGEISPDTLASCDETVAAAITALSVGDLIAYIDYGGPPEALRKWEGMLEEFSPSSSSSCSSDEESSSSSPRAPLYSMRMVGRAEASLSIGASSVK